MNTLWAAKIVPDSVLSFQTWKNQQVMKSQNRMVELANKALMTKTNQAPMPNIEHQVSAIDDNDSTLEDLSKNLKQAQQDLQISQELEFEDYLTVYLSQLGADKVSLKRLAEKLTTDQVTQTLLYLQRHTGTVAEAKTQQQPVSDKKDIQIK